MDQQQANRLEQKIDSLIKLVNDGFGSPQAAYQPSGNPENSGQVAQGVSPNDSRMNWSPQAGVDSYVTSQGFGRFLFSPPMTGKYEFDASGVAPAFSGADAVIQAVDDESRVYVANGIGGIIHGWTDVMQQGRDYFVMFNPTSPVDGAARLRFVAGSIQRA